MSRNPYLACPETGSQGRRGRCGAKASWSRASAPRRPRGNRPRKVPVARSASGFRFFGLFENQHRRPGRRAPRNPRQRLGTPAQGHGVARSGGGSAGRGRVEERGVCSGLGLCARPTCPLPDGDDLRILERIVRQLLADSRSVRHLEVAPLRHVVVLAEPDVVLDEGRGVELVDDEVRNDGLKLQRGARGNGTAAAVDLYSNVVDMCLVANLFCPP